MNDAARNEKLDAIGRDLDEAMDIINSLAGFADGYVDRSILAEWRIEATTHFAAAEAAILNA